MNWLSGLRVAGLMLAVLSFLSYFVVESRPERLSVARPNLNLVNGQVPSFNIVVAGRDIEYCKPGYGPGGLKALPCEGAERYSGRTDTIMLIRIQPGKMDVISIPRDTLVEDQFGGHKVNSTFQLGGDAALFEAGIKNLKEPGAGDVYAPAGMAALKTTLEALLGVGIDYTLVFNVEFVLRVIDALGGVDVYLPEAMDYDDNAADLHIHLMAGNQHLDAKTAIGYLRFRHGVGSDYARMDRGKTVLGQLLGKLKSPAALAVVPTILGGLGSDVLTNMDSSLMQTLLPYAGSFKPSFSTLPTIEQRWNSYLLPDHEGIQKLLGLAVSSGTPGTDASGSGDPGVDTKIGAATIVDQSGQPGLGEALARYLKRSGLPEASVISFEPADLSTQILQRPWADAVSVARYAQFMNLGVFQSYRYPEGAGPIVIQLGRDAAKQYAALMLEGPLAGSLSKP